MVIFYIQTKTLIQYFCLKLIIMETNMILPLPELYVHIFEYGFTIPLLYVINHRHNKITKNYIEFISLHCTQEKFDQTLTFFMDHDIVYGCTCILKKFPAFKFQSRHLERSCNKKSIHVLSFMFKYKYFSLLLTLDGIQSPLCHVIKKFIENDLIFQLWDLFLDFTETSLHCAINNIYDKYETDCIIHVFDDYLDQNSIFCHLIESFLYRYMRHFDLKLDQLFVNYYWIYDNFRIFWMQKYKSLNILYQKINFGELIF